MTATILDFETAAAERSIRASNSSIMRNAVALPACFEKDLLIAIARSDHAEVDRLLDLPKEEQKIGFDQWLAAMHATTAAR